MGVPRNPVKWIWSQAVFQAPRLSMYSIDTSVCGRYSRIWANRWSLLVTLAALLAGSSRTLPSRLPKMLCPTQLITRKLRSWNMGAKTLFIRVSPVLPSQPMCRVFRSLANSSIAGGADPSEGVKLT